MRSATRPVCSLEVCSVRRVSKTNHQGDPMKTAKATAIILCLVLITSAASGTVSFRKLAEVRLYDYGWQADMGILDRLANEMQTQTDSVGYVILYGGRRSVRGEVQKRMVCMRMYMLDRRGFSADRIVMLNGGYRTTATMEIWIVPHGVPGPVPTPTVAPKNVKVRRGRIRYSCDV